MSLRLRSSLFVAGAAAACLSAFAEGDARACGACFAPPSEKTVVTAHRMALSISPDQTVLWDQIKYAGSPSEFAWVLPVKPGTVIQLSTDAWFEALDGTTTTSVTAPPTGCSPPSPGCGLGCGAASYDTTSATGEFETNNNGVTIVHEGTIGPYETVTLHSSVKGALAKWLGDHGYAIDPSISPVIDAYEKEGFDFIALRLLPDKDVQSMKPVRVVSQGSVPTLPLRMVAAGAGITVGITLFVISEGRWDTKNFPGGIVDKSALVWDFALNSSNYSALRAAAISQNDNRTWITTYAEPKTLLAPFEDPTFNGAQATYVLSDGFRRESTIGDTYFQQGGIDTNTSTLICEGMLAPYAGSSEKVVQNCHATSGGGQGGGGAGGAGGTGGAGQGGAGAGGAGQGGAGGGSVTCDPAPAGEIGASKLTCAGFDDLAVALVGLHPRDVWLTRLEADLPKSALAVDLAVQASMSQSPVDNTAIAPNMVKSPCASSYVTVPRGGSGKRGGDNTRAALIASIALALAATALRRMLRQRPNGIPA